MHPFPTTETSAQGEGSAGTADRTNQAALAASITKAASRQTYYTIRFLVDRPKVTDAYRAYAYFRWVDDVLDAELQRGISPRASQQVERERFVARQKYVLDQCLRGQTPPDANPHEAMLVELVGHAGPVDAGLDAYLRNMMRVMEFDVRRRGRLVSQAELDEYTRWLAVAVTEALHHFIGDGAAAPGDKTRYLAVSGAHVVHMLRDTFDDLRTGYYNIPRDVLDADSIGPLDVYSDGYRAWVQARVQLARTYFDAGRTYLARVQSRRHRLAALAYISRFEWLLEVMERDEFRLRPNYAGLMDITTGARMGWLTLIRMFGGRSFRSSRVQIGAPGTGRP